MGMRAHCDICDVDMAKEVASTGIADLDNKRICIQPTVTIYRAQASPCWQSADLCRKCLHTALDLFMGRGK